MIVPLPELRITITKTVDGQHDYVQIISADQFALNVVLISSKITLHDARAAGTLPQKPGPGTGTKKKGTAGVC